MALVLSRKVGQVLRFPQLGIEIKVLDTRRGKIRMAIDAPKNVKVLRGELSDSTEGKTHDR